jgi:hypothetical protein
LGQSRCFDLLTVTSGVPPTSDIDGPSRHFRKGPSADISRQRDCLGMRLPHKARNAF